jgi:hypothetical protein
VLAHSTINSGSYRAQLPVWPLAAQRWLSAAPLATEAAEMATGKKRVKRAQVRAATRRQLDGVVRGRAQVRHDVDTRPSRAQ